MWPVISLIVTMVGTVLLGIFAYRLGRIHGWRQGVDDAFDEAMALAKEIARQDGPEKLVTPSVSLMPPIIMWIISALVSPPKHEGPILCPPDDRGAKPFKRQTEADAACKRLLDGLGKDKDDGTTVKL